MEHQAQPPSVTPPQSNPTEASNEPIIEVELPPYSRETPEKRDPVYTVERLRKNYTEDLPWIITNLIREEEQVVLSGPPKSGKTIMALQLAIDVAQGHEHFLLPEHTVPKKSPVLFISFEMRPRAMSSRLREQLSVDESPEVRFLFGLGTGNQIPLIFNWDETDGVRLTAHGLRLNQMIADVNPRLIIIDSLIQLHALEENNNQKMGALMRNVRRLCSIRETITAEQYRNETTHDVVAIEHATPDDTTDRMYEFIRFRPIAHIIIHHNRKVVDMARNYATPDAIRGAGAIHSEADLAITLATHRNGVSLHKSARNLAGDDTHTFAIKKDPLLRFAWTPVRAKDQNKAKLVASIYNGLRQSGLVLAKEIHRVLSEHPDCKLLQSKFNYEAFNKNFLKRLAPMNDAVTPPGRGKDKQVHLKSETTLAEFLRQFDLDGANASNLQEASPVVFEAPPPSVLEQAQAPAEVAARKTKPAKSAKKTPKKPAKKSRKKSRI